MMNLLHNVLYQNYLRNNNEMYTLMLLHCLLCH